VVEHNPLTEHTADGSRFLVTFLADEPKKGAFDGLEPPDDSGEKFAVRGREIYLFMPQGFQGARLSNEFWEKRVGTKATTRNWNTVTKLLAMASA
jgi:uncharacterized protein (DUF1697 family)